MFTALQGRHLFKQMLRIRRFEEAAAEQYSAGKIRGFLHLYIGEEAIAVGIMENLREEDRVFATYREHGHALARGLSARSIMAEMFGKMDGCCRGRGGSMHIFSNKHQFFGGNAIVGGALPLAVGTALADKMQGLDRVSVCFFGEGAMAEGEFHESMNLAGLWQLPVLFVCENNYYAMGTALKRSESEVNLIKKASSYGIKSVSIDGMNLNEVYQAAATGVRDIRSNQKPLFLECRTFRFRAHSMFDPELYRKKEEVDLWKKKDPIDRFQQDLLSQNLIKPEDVEEINDEVRKEINDAIAFAEASGLEPEDELSRFVYYTEEGKDHG